MRVTASALTAALTVPLAVLLALLPKNAWAERDSALIDALEGAQRLVLGQVGEVSRLAHASYTATVSVERMLRGSESGRELDVIAWEEPAPSLPPRLSPGRRVLLALEALPTASIWTVRIPDAAARTHTWALAGRGAGYIERPSGIELDTLEHYLALAPDARAGDAGVVLLSRLAAVAGSRLAHASVARLTTVPELNAHLDQAAANALIDALLRRSEGDVGSAVLVLIEARRPANLRSPLVARIDAAAPEAPAILHAALGALDGQIVDERALALLASPDDEQRLAAARWARGDAAITRLRSLSRHDPSPSVRAAALRRLETLESIGALPEALDSLDDPAPEVRRAAAESIASMGPAAISDLRSVVDFEKGDAARTAIAALGLMGEPAAQSLREIAETNPDPGLRALAEIALGLPIGHRH